MPGNRVFSGKPKEVPEEGGGGGAGRFIRSHTARTATRRHAGSKEPCRGNQSEQYSAFYGQSRTRRYPEVVHETAYYVI